MDEIEPGPIERDLTLLLRIAAEQHSDRMSYEIKSISKKENVMTDESYIDNSEDEVQVKRGRKSKPKAKADSELIRMLLKKAYRPYGNDPEGWGDFMIERDDDIVEPEINEEGYADRDRVKAGTVIHVPRGEARRMIENDIAERADAL